MQNENPLQFNALIGYLYHINFIMGTGFLGLPFTFYYAGVIPGFLTLTLISITTCITSLWMLESMARTNALHHIRGSESEFIQQEYLNGCYYEISETRKFELTEIGEVLFGLPELNEQKYIQATFAILRYIAFLSITIFSIYIIIYNVYNPSNPIPSQLQRENSNTVNLLLRFDIQKWLVTLPVIAYALNLNHGISPLSHPITPKNHLKPMYIMVFISLWLAYAIVGLTVSVAFLHLVNENASLNWAYFVSFPNSIFVRTISYFILLFPSLDVLSIYALLVTTISNNIYLVVMCRDTSQGSFTRLDRFGKLLFRLIIAFIPLIGSLFVSNLVALLKIAGLIALILQFLIPCASQIQSKRLCRIELEKFRKESSLTVTNKSSHIIETDSEIQNITHKQKAITGKIREFLFNVEARTSFSGWYSNNITIIFVSIVGALSFCCASLSIVYS